MLTLWTKHICFLSLIDDIIFPELLLLQKECCLLYITHSQFPLLFGHCYWKEATQENNRKYCLLKNVPYYKCEEGSPPNLIFFFQLCSFLSTLEDDILVQSAK